jgi:decaprenylphospho-beta-D-ribofuranose 2-oxidase
VDGCFSECLLGLRLLLAGGQIVTCSREENAELFRATCGGMGLTGVILDARFRLQRIQSAYFDQTTYKCPNLEAVLQRLEEARHVRYAVAWIDCVSQGASLGRSVLTVGDHATQGPLVPHSAPKLTVPFVAPDWTVSPPTIKAFNALFYHKTLRAVSQARVHYAPFFYPLDIASHWNRLYGKAGFTQYQFVIPRAAGPQGLRRISERIAASQMGSALAVVKTTGPQNGNPLSFPLEGYTLALDFKHQPGLFKLLDELDAMVLGYGGRVYLTKDVRLNERNFKQSYPRWQEFQALREKVGAIGRFASLQSKRLGLD